MLGANFKYRIRHSMGRYSIFIDSDQIGDTHLFGTSLIKCFKCHFMLSLIRNCVSILVYSMSLCSPVFSSWFFEVLGYPKVSKPNMANGVLMAAVFFLVRIAVMPVYYTRMCSVYGTEAFYRVSFGGRSAWIFSSICLDIMNVMWMHKIARGCYKVLRSSRRSKPESQENGKTD